MTGQQRKCVALVRPRLLQSHEIGRIADHYKRPDGRIVRRPQTRRPCRLRIRDPAVDSDPDPDFPSAECDTPGFRADGAVGRPVREATSLMKLSLVVAQGVHTGKVIPVTAAEFIIGRDPQCQLRPASPAVSKQHCALTIRDDRVFVRDCGSTNGTFVNNEQVAAEREVKAGDRLRVGPLEFDLKIETGAPQPKSAPVITVPAAAKPGSKPATKPAGKPSPAAKVASATDTLPEGATVVMDPPAAKSGPNATTVVDTPGNGLEDDPDHAAALLLGLDDPTGANPTLEQMSSDPTTVMEMPALGGQPGGEAKKPEAKKINADSSSAAA